MDRELIVEFIPAFIKSSTVKVFAGKKFGTIRVEMFPWYRRMKRKFFYRIYKMNNEEINGFHSFCKEFDFRNYEKTERCGLDGCTVVCHYKDVLTSREISFWSPSKASIEFQIVDYILSLLRSKVVSKKGKSYLNELSNYFREE